jgi:hypothetical protein
VQGERATWPSWPTLARLPLTVSAMLAILAQAHGRKTITEKSTLVVERAPEGRVTSGSWDGEKVVLKDPGARSPQCRWSVLSKSIKRRRCGVSHGANVSHGNGGGGKGRGKH